MKVKDLFLYYYSSPLKPPFTYREGFIIKILLENNEERFGEVAPLLGFNKESLRNAYYELKHVLPQLIGKDLLFIQSLLSDRLYPSVYFGLYSLFFQNLTIDGLVSGLLDVNSYQEEIDRLLKNGIRFAKIKLQSFSPDDAISSVNKILSHTDEIRFHIDMNRKWKKQDLERFLLNVDIGRLRYIEEPLHDQRAFLNYINHSSYCFAFDESLRKYKTLPLDKIAQLIIKPSMQKNMVDLLKQYQKKSSLSSSFESLVGIKSICHLAKHYHLNTPLGIDTLSAFKEPICLSSYSIKDGFITIDPIRLDAKRLTNVSI